MVGPRTQYYRDKANGQWAGVCAGLADYFGVDVTSVSYTHLTLPTKRIV